VREPTLFRRGRRGPDGQKIPYGNYYILYNEQVKNYITGEKKWTNRYKTTGTEVKSHADKQLSQFKAALRKNPIIATAKATDILLRDLLKKIREEKERRTAHYHLTKKYELGQMDRWLGHLYLGQIDEAFLYKFVERLRQEETLDGKVRKGWGDKNIRHFLTDLSGCFRNAIENGLFFGKNPVKNFPLPPKPEPRDIVLEIEEQVRLLEAAYDPDFQSKFDKLKAEGADAKTLESWQRHFDYQDNFRSVPAPVLRDVLELILTYGFRKGEVIGVKKKTKEGKFLKIGGLRVGCLVPRKGKLGFDLVFERTKYKGGLNRGVKTTRIASVLDRVVQIIQKHSVGKQKGELIFDLGDIDKGFDEAVRFAGIETFSQDGTPVKLQIKDLRKTALTNMRAAGWKIETIARIAGHTSLETLYAHYQRRQQEQQELEDAQKYADFFSKKDPSSVRQDVRQLFENGQKDTPAEPA
jgi:hypothetical protein